VTESKASKHIRRSTTENYEHQIQVLTEQLHASDNGKAEMVRKFEDMYRRSEAMRNRQIDTINRLLKGGTIDEELVIALAEVANLQVQLGRYEETVADLETRLKEATKS
jgi:predicted RNase H-like nuclease (RuvC/YqgF family)